MKEINTKMPDDSKQPQPEKLDIQEGSPDESNAGAAPKTATSSFNNDIRPRRSSYKPSSKATFMGLAVVGAILAVNIGVVIFVMKGQDDQAKKINRETVTLSSEALSQLGMSKTAVNNAGTELVIGPDSKFNGSVTMGSQVNIAGELNLNSTLSAADAKLAKLQANDVQFDQFNVSGDGTLSSLNLRKDLIVAGTTNFQGAVSMAQLLTVNNNANIAGSLAVGGSLSVRNFQASSLVSDTTLTIGGHIITRGNAPRVSAGGGAGSNGTASVSGNDASGTIAVNVGAGSGGGLLVSLSFTNAYSSTPHVVITPVGRYANVYVNRTASGFTISAEGSLAPGGYAFDYMVMQ